MSRMPINRRNPQRTIRPPAIARSIPKAPPPPPLTSRTVLTPEQFDQLDRTMAQRGKPKPPGLQTGRFPD